MGSPIPPGQRQIIIHNGLWLERPGAEALHFHGAGVFETMLAHRCKAASHGSFEVHIIALERHLRRLAHGAKVIGCKLPDSGVIEKGIAQAVTRYNWSEETALRLRVILYESDWYLSASAWKASFDVMRGISAVPLSVERSFPEIKSCSALPCVYARREARDKGADEALLVDRSGIVREGAWSNLFWVDQNGTIVTTESGILSGITRSIVFDLCGSLGFNFKVCDTEYEKFAAEAQEVFITQATHSIVPVVRLGPKRVGSGLPGSITCKLRESYSALRGKDAFACDNLTWSVLVAQNHPS